ncbi:hypothetical protein BDZ45DRAFT_743420 [Acephala macrosclerotiorum]|nr:hypothetical protein BDZ45DRAFT_743420 [Acephala macrosclerotiorum]
MYESKLDANQTKPHEPPRQSDQTANHQLFLVNGLLIFVSRYLMKISPSGIWGAWLEAVPKAEAYSLQAIINVNKHRPVPPVQFFPGITIVANLLFSWYADWFKDEKGRIHVRILLCFTGLISGAILLNPPRVNTKLFALFLNNVQLGFRSVLFAWANDICRKGDAKRAIVLKFMNAMSK